MSIYRSLLQAVIGCTIQPFGLAVQMVQTSSDAPDTTLLAEIDRYLQQQLNRLKVPGAALVIVEGERIVHLRGFGRAFPDGGAPTPQTPFSIGSITKSFTALAVMQLVEAGKIVLDDPVRRYLPWFQVADPGASTRMTVRQLLNQTSGLPLFRSWQLLADFDDRPDAAERQARALATLALKRAPGEAFEYSNLNYILLGLIIEAASGEPYPDYIQRHIFTPLEMRHSYTSKAAASLDGMAVGHQLWFGFPVPAPDLPMPRGSMAAGMLICSAEDMGHYLIVLLNEGRYGEAQILSPEGVAELHRPMVEASTWGDSAEQYGMGWYIEEQDQTRVISHSGMMPDFYTFVALLPEQKKGIALLINANHFMGQMMFGELGAGMVARLAGKPPPALWFGVIPWLLRSLLLIPALQIAGVATTLWRLRQWRQSPVRRPNGRQLWGRHILLPLIFNGATALTLTPILGRMRGFLMLFMPDVFWTTLICGGFALLWGFLRTGLILRVLHRSQESEP